MIKCGLTIHKELIAHGDYTSTCAAQYVEGFVKGGATAVVCASDLIAHGVLAELYRLGLRVPQDISVTGFDDIPLARYTTPPLTTIKQNRLMIGKSVCMHTESSNNNDNNRSSGRYNGSSSRHNGSRRNRKGLFPEFQA